MRTIKSRIRSVSALLAFWLVMLCTLPAVANETVSHEKNNEKSGKVESSAPALPPDVTEGLPPIRPAQQATLSDTNSLAAKLEGIKPGNESTAPEISQDLARSIATANRQELTVEQRAELIRQQLKLARYLRTMRRSAEATPMLVGLLADDVPVQARKSALLELAAAAQDDNNLARAQQIYAQFLAKWADDPRVPEILLRQGQLYRQMGMNNLALTKFYAVMTSALVLKNDRTEYYIRIVAQAQTEIAQTHYELGKYPEAIEYYTRLLKIDNPFSNRGEILYRLVRCCGATGQHQQAVAYGQDYLAQFPNGPEEPEVRFNLALALKELGRNNESLTQVLTLLQEQSMHASERPEVWAYWQQRTGNLIANQLYREGDYGRALDIYMNLVKLDSATSWQIPVWYQIGMTYERLWQPQKAMEAYNKIIARESDLGENASPSLKTVVDMARWRIGFIEWQNKAESATFDLQQTNAPPKAQSSDLLSINTSKP